MIIAHNNFMQELANCVSEMLVIIAELKKIEQDTPQNHSHIIMLNGRFVEATQYLPAIITFVAAEQPNPDIVGDKLKRAILLIGEVLNENTRILNNTPKIIRDTNDLYAEN